MLSIEIELSEQDIQNIRELAAHYGEDPNDFVNETMADLIGDAKMILEDENEDEENDNKEDDE